jgi:uncharacterized protein
MLEFKNKGPHKDGEGDFSNPTNKEENKDFDPMTGLKPSVGWLSYLLLIAGSFVLAIVLSNIYTMLIMFSQNQTIDTEELLRDPTLKIILQITPLLAGILLLYLVHKILKLPQKTVLRLKQPNHWSYYLIAVIGILALNFLMDFLWNLIHPYLPDILSNYESYVRETYTSSSSIHMIIIMILGTLGAGIVEELTFRGLIQSSFHRKYKPALAILLTSALFGLIHFNVVQGISTFLIGLLLGIITYKSESIYPAIIAHISNNLVSLLMLNLSNINT